MNVKILLVEDDPSFLEIVAPIICEFGVDISLSVARSRDSAIAMLTENIFDLVILDLKIPIIDDALDADAEHGRYVLNKTRDVAGGTPLIILTGSPAESFIDAFLVHSEQVDVWGDQTKMATVRFLRKSQLDELPGVISPCIEAVRAVSYVEIRPNGKQVNLDWAQDRLIRIFVRRRGGVSCSVYRIGGGLSGAHVFRVAVWDESGAPLLNAVLKIGTREMVETECRNYDRHAQRLNERATPRLLEDIRFGAGPIYAVSYRLAETYTNTMFEVALENSERAAKVATSADALLAPWREGVHETRRTIRDIRRRMLNDEKTAKIAAKYGLNWIGSFESRPVQVRWCCVHGDFHGGNMLIDNNDAPIFIDYGDIGEGPASIDWVMLELSILFHPDGCARGSDWPTLENCSNWSDIDVFASDTSLTPYLRACRDAAHRAGAGPREVAACAYAYVLRQLNYEDTDKARALAIINGVKRFIEVAT